ncbi:MAG: HlyD family efflux transporter periplasmic adaptor subunit [Azoarcus sp.]|jgi:membrane fusion protein (multidrug efflux system)|nr:HlyD family efflux transporter periplasmic adaptor subunit [Azoarcus sp.]
MSIQDASPPTPDAPPPPPANGGARKRAMRLLALLFLTLAALYGTYWHTVLRWRETTDDAYVAGHIIQITPQIGGVVRAVLVDDTDTVAAGDTLIELDAADSRVELDQAEAALAQAVREVRVLNARNDALRAEAAMRQAEVDRLAQDLARREEIARRGFVSKEDLAHSREALRIAQAALVAARQQLAANRALTAGTGFDNHPGVLQAAAKVEEAWLAWARARITAPAAGQIARRNVQTGQRVAAGAPLMAIVPLHRLWVEANFKEVQLGKIRVGQAVTLTADLHGPDIQYHGRITGLAAGTGSAFALLPAQNATGNWIKIVQRVPVRIELAPEQLEKHPLRIGLSMQATVDLRDSGNAPPAAITTPIPPRTAPAPSSDALEAARARITAIIRQHSAAAGNGQ